MIRPAILAALATVISSAPVLRAEIVFSGGGITENFDSLGPEAVNGAFSGTIGEHSAVPGTTGFEATRIAGSGTGSSALLVSDGGLGTGGVQTLGAASASDRALGTLASSTRTMAFGFSLVNQAPGTVITQITLSFNQENWRTPTVEDNTLTAAWGTSASAGVTTSNYLTASGMTALPALDMTLAFTASNTVLNGNLSANQVAKSHVFSSLNLAFNERMFVRWRDIDNGGNDAAIGMDDMTISFVTSVVPEAPAVALGAVATAAAGLACVVRRLRRTKA